MSQTFNKKSPTVKRILREAAELASSPSPDYHAAPLDSNLFEWHFTLRGPPSTPYSSGIYHGRITLPPQYPLRPPSFRFLTPSGRFEVNREICLSISGHHEDTWQPAWGVRTAVVALRGFMEGEAAGQLGGMECSREVRAQIAGESARWRCEGCGGMSCEEILKESAERAKELGLAVEEVAPEGLKLAYKDEMKKQGGEGSAAADGDEATGEDSGAPTPAEFQSSGRATPLQQTGGALPQTPMTPAPVQYQQQQAPMTPAPYQPNAPEQLPAQLPPYLQPRYAPLPQQQLPRVETPWLDKLIWALVAVLAALVARRYWGLELIV